MSKIKKILSFTIVLVLLLSCCTMSYANAELNETEIVLDATIYDSEESALESIVENTEVQSRDLIDKVTAYAKLIRSGNTNTVQVYLYIISDDLMTNALKFKELRVVSSSSPQTLYGSFTPRTGSSYRMIQYTAAYMSNVHVGNVSIPTSVSGATVKVTDGQFFVLEKDSWIAGIEISKYISIH